MWPVLLWERITEWEALSRLSYRLAGKTIPVREYDATVELRAAADGGTELTWSVSSRPLVPGTGVLMSVIVKSTVLFLAWRLRSASPKGRQHTS